MPLCQAWKWQQESWEAGRGLEGKWLVEDGCAGADPSLDQSQAGDGIEQDQGRDRKTPHQCQVLSCYTWAISHPAQEGKGFASETSPKALASKLPCQPLG